MLIYSGPSRIDGRPIVVLATGIKRASKNTKTGHMVQLVILRADISPLDALNSGADISICGDCPVRNAGCYVNVARMPQTVWKAWKRGAYDGAAYQAKARRALRTMPLRLGAYGDPAAVPDWVWERLLERNISRKWTGYTHRWRQTPWLRNVVMASCDTTADATEALQQGWRVFLVTSGKAPPLPGFVECVNTARGTQCADCKACDGARGGAATNFWIGVHGRDAKRHLAVLRSAPGYLKEVA